MHNDWPLCAWNSPHDYTCSKWHDFVAIWVCRKTEYRTVKPCILLYYSKIHFKPLGRKGSILAWYTLQLHKFLNIDRRNFAIIKFYPSNFFLNVSNFLFPSCILNTHSLEPIMVYTWTAQSSGQEISLSTELQDYSSFQLFVLGVRHFEINMHDYVAFHRLHCRYFYSLNKFVLFIKKCTRLK